jgi:transposase
VDVHGVPLSLAVTGANRHDASPLEAVLNAIVIPRPKAIHRLCADTGYTGVPARATARAHHHEPWIKQRGEPLPRHVHRALFKKRRWAVESGPSRFNRFRKLMVRYEKSNANYEALLHIAAAIIRWRKVAPIYG